MGRVIYANISSWMADEGRRLTAAALGVFVEGNGHVGSTETLHRGVKDMEFSAGHANVDTGCGASRRA